MLYFGMKRKGKGKKFLFPFPFMAFYFFMPHFIQTRTVALFQSFFPKKRTAAAIASKTPPDTT